MKTPHAFTCLLACLLAASVSHGASVVQFPVRRCTVTEGSGRLEIPVTRTNDLDTVVSVDLATVPGTAVPGVNYTGVAATLTFAAGETRRTVVVPILNDGVVAPNKVFNVALSSPKGGAGLGPLASLQVTILDNDKGLHLYVPALPVNEDAGQVRIKVARGDDGDSPVSVDYATSDGTAKAGQDYTATVGTLVFAPGEVLKSFVVPVRNSAQPGTNRTFKVTLSNPTGGGVLSAPQVTTVTIKIPDPGVGFDAARYTVREDAAFVRVCLTRGRIDSAGPVDLTTEDVTAQEGLDYVGVTQTIRFGLGEREKTVDIPILRDALNEGAESFLVKLSQPSGAVVLGSRSSVNVVIKDDAPKVGFAQSVVGFRDTAGTAVIAVLRGGDALAGALTVAYQTRDGSARAGLDYVARVGTVEFQPNQTVQELAIPLLRSASATGLKDFTVTLGEVSDGSLPGIASTTVRIFRPGTFHPVMPAASGPLNLEREGGASHLTWAGDGALQRAERLTGPWAPVPFAVSPYAFRPTSSAGFYRLQSSRATQVYVPRGYDGRKPMPLVLMLHALGFSGEAARGYLDLNPLADAKGFLVCYPDGTTDAAGATFWNGPDFLDFYGSPVDDSAYLRAVIEEIMRQFAVDPKRIYSTGVSSGGAMSHRLACEQADLIAGIAPISGRTYYSPDYCHPTQPVNVLQIDGSGDAYLGGPLSSPFPVLGEVPGALRTVQNWARLNGCREPMVEAAPSLDVTSDVEGLETTVLRYTQSPPGGAVELWTLNGGNHAPTLSSGFPALLIDWMLAHPKP